jgi:sec-independent protein translocase protein TatA
MRFGPLELGVILVILLLIVGPKKIPELAKGIGQGLKEFKSANKSEQEE